MPSKDLKQHNLMELVDHNPAAAKRLGIVQSVGQDFVKADAGRAFDHAAHRAKLKADARSAPAVRTKPRGNRGGGY
jgi:hypothetical protein